ncbi:MAG: hypothetical protein PVF43_16255, partial [Candidatus Eiseniibacteriota bacterium]
RRRRWIECLAEQPLFRGERLRELARRPGSAPPELDGILMSLGIVSEFLDDDRPLPGQPDDPD